MPDVETIKSVSKDVLIPLGSAGAIGMALFQGWIYFSVQIRRIDDIDRRLASVERAATVNRWTCRDHERFVYEMRSLNAGLAIPSPPKECE
jgi:hypothetical protein